MSPYITLGVDKTATKTEIKKAYYRLAKEKHPDKGGDEEDFKPIAEAWAVLQDDEKRAEYDTTGVMPTNIEQAILNEAQAFIARMIRETLAAMVEQGMERQPGNFVDAMKKFVQDKMVENQQEMDKTHVADKLYANTLENIFIKNPDESDRADMIAGTIRELQEENDFNQFALGNGLKVFAMCITLLDMYGCNMPRQIEQPTVRLGGSIFANITTSGRSW